MSDRPTVPYGAWPSPVSASRLAESGVGFEHLEVDGGTAYWLETRPGEGGRGVVVRETDDGYGAVVPDDTNVRTLVHEYGGGDFAVRDGTVWYVEYDDQRIYRTSPEGDPEPITPDPAVERGDRYADLTVSPDGQRIYCVRERHGGEGEPDNELVVVPTDGSGPPEVVASGQDFYSSPRLDAGGHRIAWTTWNHPCMPWDGTQLHVADVDVDGHLANERTVLGGPEESVFQPTWGPDGLFAVSDHTDWWNLYRIDPDGGDRENCYPTDAEFGTPQWVLGLSTYAVLDDGRIAAAVTREGRRRLGILEPGTGAGEYDLRFPDLPVSVHKHPRVRSDGHSVVFAASRTDAPDRIVRFDPGGELTVVRVAADRSVDADYVSDPEHLSFPTDDEEFDAHGFYYPPHNPDVSAPDDERPPVVVTVHGGPTSQTVPAYDPEIQFFTTRGIGVFDVNYRGSTGYGRRYRDRLKGQWGVVDVADCSNAARYLAESGRADPDRIAIRGGSAGGYAVLCSLAFHDAFDAGISYYGVADLSSLAESTHKFESRYLDSLVGPYPNARELYRERSPVHHADGIDRPVLLLQGDEDPVVPPEQARTMLSALAENGVDHAYVEFEGEQHGFRRAESIRRAAEAELSFLGQVFGFAPDDDLGTVDLSGRGSEGDPTPE